MEIERKKRRELKHLGIARTVAIHALVCVSNIYDYAKQNSGPLRSTVSTVESAVTTVVGPVYRKIQGVPDDLLVFLDDKVLALNIEFLSSLFFIFFVVDCVRSTFDLICSIVNNFEL